jgi:hypothetical protein
MCARLSAAHGDPKPCGNETQKAERNTKRERDCAAHLVRREVLDGGGEVVEQLGDERLRLLQLQHDKLALALVADLQEGVARHVLHAGVRLVHELKQLVDDRLEELPVRAQELGVLADDVHDVGGDDGL